MKKTLSTIFAMTVIVMVFATTGFSQTLRLTWDNTTMDGVSAPLPFGCSIVVAVQATDIPNPVAPSMDTPYFLTGGDTKLQLGGFWASMATIPYNDQTNGFGFIEIDLASYSDGDTFKVFARVYDNISYDAYSPEGIWNGAYMSGEAKTNWYQTETVNVLVNKNDGNNMVEFVFSTPEHTLLAMSPSSGQLPAGEPVPEPSAMFLAAIGVAWLRRRIKKV